MRNLDVEGADGVGARLTLTRDAYLSLRPKFMVLFRDIDSSKRFSV